MVREPILTTVAISDLRPTQITVGMREVAAKRQRWREIAAKEGAKFLGKHMIPVVLGPKSRHYVVDHHHLALALQEEGVKDVAVTPIANLGKLDQDAFWTVMDNRSWMHPFDSQRRAAALQRHSQTRVRSGRRSVSLAGWGIAPRRRLCQGHDAFQRIPVGGFSAPAHEAQSRRA